MLLAISEHLCYNEIQNKKTMTERLEFEEFVDEVRVSLAARKFEIFGSRGNYQCVECDTIDEFMSVLQVVRSADGIDEELDIVYV